MEIKCKDKKKKIASIFEENRGQEAIKTMKQLKPVYPITTSNVDKYK